MAVNTSPIFSKAGQIGWSTTVITTAVPNYLDNTGGTVVFTAGADGSYLQRIRFRPAGSTTSNTVARVWISSGTLGTYTTNILYDEITIPAATANNAAALVGYELPLNFAIPANYKIVVTLGTTVTAGIAVTVIGGSYTA